MTTVAPPTWPRVVPDAIPREMVDEAAWYPAIIRPKRGKPGKYDKIPGNPTTGELATWSDPTTRCTFSDAFMAYESGRFPGIGYMMAEEHGRIGIDLDDSIAEDGSIKPWAQEIVQQFEGAYWERSISGKGLRGFCLGTLPVGGCRSKIEGCSVELYADERFLVVTGQALQYVDALPELQAAVDALHARLTAGRVRATGTAVASGLTGRVTDLTPDELGILEDVFGSRFAARLTEIWTRDELDAAGASEDDWALENEIAWCAISRGYEGDALHLVVERIMRTGPYRRKWDEARGAVSWLAQDVANAIKTTQERRAKYQSGPAFELHDAGDVPADETLEQKVIRLERENKQLRGTVAVQMTVIRAHNDVERKLRDQIERLNRQIYADYRLSKVKTLSSSQKDTIKAMARVATKRAEHFDNDAPIITGETLGAEIGKCATTARTAAEAVCSLPGSPIRRVSEYRDDGVYGKLTTYELAVRDPVEILEQFVVIAESLEEKKPSRPQPPRCSDHPNAPVLTYSRQVCGRCRKTLASTFPGEDALCAENVRIDPDDAPVSEPVVTHEQNVRIAAPSAVSLADRRAGLFDTDPDAPRVVAVDVGPPEPSGSLASRTIEHHAHVGGSQEAERRDLDTLDTCSACGQYTLKRRRSGVWTCASCSAVLHVEPWAQGPPAYAEPPPEPSSLPMAPRSHIARGFLPPKRPARIAGAEVDDGN